MRGLLCAQRVGRRRGHGGIGDDSYLVARSLRRGVADGGLSSQPPHGSARRAFTKGIGMARAQSRKSPAYWTWRTSSRDAEIRGLAPINTTPNETVGAFA